MTARIYKNLTFQVLVAITIGLAIGHFLPDWGVALQPLADGFIRLIKMVVAPIVFLTIVCGIASMGGLGKVGRVGGKALIYFEVVTTLALVIGLVVAGIVKPGTRDGHGIAVAAKEAEEAGSADAAGTGSSVEPSIEPAVKQEAAVNQEPVAAVQAETNKPRFIDHLLNVIPVSIVGAFAEGNLLQILFFAVLFGVAVAALDLRDSPVMSLLEQLTEIMFRVVAMIMKVAPLGALGAMAFTVGKYGLGSLIPLAKLMACVYITMALFVFLVLGLICRMFGFSLWQFLKYIREEIVLVLGTSSSESALPRMIEKLDRLGCSRGVVGLVIPAGYSFNLDGTSIYLSMAVMFIAQAYEIELSIWQQLSAIGILMLTSKGAAAVTGAGFVTLTATLEATQILPVQGVQLLLGVDRFMSEARAITNLIGNGVATIVISKLEGEFDEARYQAAIAPHPMKPPQG